MYEWIPVKERIPATNGWYPVVTEKFGNLEVDLWEWYEDNWEDEGRVAVVLYWTHLPPIPEIESSDDGKCKQLQAKVKLLETDIETAKLLRAVDRNQIEQLHERIKKSRALLRRWVETQGIKKQMLPNGDVVRWCHACIKNAAYNDEKIEHEEWCPLEDTLEELGYTMTEPLSDELLKPGEGHIVHNCLYCGDDITGIYDDFCSQECADADRRRRSER